MINPRLEELRGKFQENPRRYFAPYANELRKAGDPAQAIAVCRAHLAGQPGHVSGHIVLGQALYEAGEANEARDIFTAALELDPENLIALRSLGEIAQVNGEFSTARQWYQRLLDADPRNSEVAQLLRDIPTEAPPAEAPEPLGEPVDEPTPFTIREEVAAAEAPTEPVSLAPSEPAPPAPRFHTAFSGSGPAYKTEEDKREEALAGQGADESEEAFVDLQPTAHDQQPHVADEAKEWGPPAPEPEPLDVVESEMEGATVAAEVHESPSPDDSFDLADAVTGDAAPQATYDSESDDVLETTFETIPFAADPESESEATMSSEPVHAAEVSYETDEIATPDQLAPTGEPALEIEEFAADALNPESFSKAPGETAEPPKATFAEHGFEGPANEEAGWMTTPSAAYSDLESAPEDWFDTAHADETAAEAQTDVPPVAEEESEPDHSTDSWFDEVPGATTIEATEITSDDLWLPPELPQVTAAEASAEPEVAEAESAAEPEAPSWSSAMDEEQPVAAAPESGSQWSEPTESMAPPEPVEAAQQPWTTESHGAPDEMEPATAAAANDFEAEPPQFDVEALSDDDAAIVVDHPAEVPAVAEWSEPEPVSAYAEVDREEVIDIPPVYSTVDSADSLAPSSDAIGHTPAGSVPAPTPAPFITETLAELYLQQGFRDEALSIYRQLLERNPGDEQLKSRIASIEQREAPAPAPVSAESRAASQSVRTFFSRLARRPAMATPASEPHGASTEASAQPDAPFNVAASALANLFSASKPPAADEGAASTLAGAFSDPAGRPSRAAEGELSLDHLFRDVPPGGSASGGAGGGGGGGLTLDEFYSSPGAASGSSTEPGPESGPEESGGTDIRQFTAWLEGLRKK